MTTGTVLCTVVGMACVCVCVCVTRDALLLLFLGSW